VVVGSEQVEPARLHFLQALDSSPVDTARRAVAGKPVVVEFAAGEIRAAVAANAVSLADENLQPAACRVRIQLGPVRLAARKPAAKTVERRSRALERFLERGQ